MVVHYLCFQRGVFLIFQGKWIRHRQSNQQHNKALHILFMKTKIIIKHVRWVITFISGYLVDLVLTEVVTIKYPGLCDHLSRIFLMGKTSLLVMLCAFIILNTIRLPVDMEHWNPQKTERDNFQQTYIPCGSSGNILGRFVGIDGSNSWF